MSYFTITRELSFVNLTEAKTVQRKRTIKPKAQRRQQRANNGIVVTKSPSKQTIAVVRDGVLIAAKHTGIRTITKHYREQRETEVRLRLKAK